jgi:UDP-N-acetyl-D-mannosaminuronic acid transferase (WecB/TagA/CpsF family)
MDVVAGFQLLAPEWIRRIGLEWLFRAVVDPRRIPQLVKLPFFVLELVWYRIFRAKAV